MTNRHENRSWDSFLPPAYKWIDGLKIDSAEKASTEDWLAIPAAPGKEPKVDANINEEMKSSINELIQQLGWKARSPLSTTLDRRNIILLPISKLKVTPSQKGREIGLLLAKNLDNVKYDSLAIAEDPSIKAADILEGYLAGSYDQLLFKGQEAKRDLPTKITILGKATSESIHQAKAISKSLLLTKLLQDAPANWLTPERWSEIASHSLKGAEVEIMGRDKLRELKMGSFLSVAAGSPLEPQLISIKIKGKNPGKTVALVGKGLTFDAGGISLKGAAGMGEMKYDMSGGAAVMGAAHYFNQIQPEHNVHCIIGAVENMPSGTATRPGDIVQAANGKTIEVLNTDAEGRLVLADLLSFASSKEPDLIMDFATLTGAVLHGLGHCGAAFMTPNPKVSKLIWSNSRHSGEPMWELPLWPELAREVKSEIADLKNIAKPNVQAGTIIGGVFLKEFVKDSIPWAHIDIAGTGWTCSATGYPKTGASGFGVRLMADVVNRLEI